MKKGAQLTVPELAEVVAESGLPARVAARFSLILSLIAVVLSALAIAFAVHR